MLRAEAKAEEDGKEGKKMKREKVWIEVQEMPQVEKAGPGGGAGRGSVQAKRGVGW